MPDSLIFPNFTEKQIMKQSYRNSGREFLQKSLAESDKHYDHFIEKFLPTAVSKNMGIAGMKIPVRDRIFAHGGIITMKEAMEYVMSLPISTIIVGLDDIAELEENISIAENFKPLKAEQMLGWLFKFHSVGFKQVRKSLLRYRLSLVNFDDAGAVSFKKGRFNRISHSANIVFVLTGLQAVDNDVTLPGAKVSVLISQ